MKSALLLLLSSLALSLCVEIPPPVPGEYAILLKKGESLGHHISQFGRLMDDESHFLHSWQIGENFKAFGVKVSENVLAKLRQQEGIEAIVENSYLTIGATQENPINWGLDRMDQRELPLNNKYIYANSAGEGVDAYIIDTGINLKHVEFKNGNAVWGTTTPRNSEDLDLNGHGSHVGSTVCGAESGVAKKSRCVAVKVMKDSGLGTVFDITGGVSWVAEQHRNGTRKSVANMSLGSPISNPIIDASVKALVESGVIVIVAAGNANRNACNGSPGGQPDMITVGASDMNDQRASFSNWGSCVDVFAPGVNITAAWWDSDTEYFVASGTSMASPHVAGLAALILAEKPFGFNQEDMRNEIVKMSTQGVLSDVGEGSPNLLAFTNPPPSF